MVYALEVNLNVLGVGIISEQGDTALGKHRCPTRWPFVNRLEAKVYQELGLPTLANSAGNYSGSYLRFLSRFISPLYPVVVIRPCQQK